MKSKWQHYKETTLKGYFKRVLGMTTKPMLIYWWILRLLMVWAFIDTTFLRGSTYQASNPPIQIIANLVGMFAFEIIQLFPENSRLRYFSPSFQYITATGFFLGSFGGAYCNLYYSLPMYDKILHATGTAEGVYIGYEYLSATQLKLKKTTPHQIVNLWALGFGFILASAWELFEFIYDQFFGGDAQHWNLKAALDTVGGDIQRIFQMIPIKDMDLFAKRFPLMDTMADIIMNFLGGVTMFVILRFVPYRHRGKGDINRQIEAETAAQSQLPAEAAV